MCKSYKFDCEFPEGWREMNGLKGNDEFQFDDPYQEEYDDLKIEENAQLNNNLSIFSDHQNSQLDGESQAEISQKIPKKSRKKSGNKLHSHLYLPNHELPSQRSSLRFPASKELYEYVESKIQLTSLMSLEQRRGRLVLNIKVHELGSKKIKHLVVVCASCGHKLLMKFQTQKDSRFKLNYFDNTHLHENQKSVIPCKDFKSKLILKELEAQDKKCTLHQFEKILMKKYKITEKDFRYFIYNIQEKRDQRMKSLLQFIKQQNQGKIWMCTEVSTSTNLLSLKEFTLEQEFVTNPSFFMFTLDYMFESSKKFSKICSISMVPDFVQNKGKHGFKKWRIIIFSGLSNFNDFMPFAFVLLDERESCIQLLTEIVHKFFKQFEVEPSVIISPYDKSHLELVQNVRATLKLSFLHIYDGLCYVDAIGQQLEDLSNRIYYQEIVLSRSKQQFREKCEILLKKVEPTKKNIAIFNQLVQIAPKMCFGMIETHIFIGLIFLHSANKYALNLMRRIFTKEIEREQEGEGIKPKVIIVRKKWRNNPPSFVKSLFLMIRGSLRYNRQVSDEPIQRGGYCQWRGEAYLGVPEIQTIRANTKKEFLDLLLEQFGKILQLEASQRELKDPQVPEMKTFDILDRKLKSIFTVSAVPEYNSDHQFTKLKWRCNCCYSLKSGLPCAHEIKAALATDTSLLDQIHQLWLKERVYADNLKRRGRIKRTRRNTEK